MRCNANAMTSQNRATKKDVRHQQVKKQKAKACMYTKLISKAFTNTKIIDTGQYNQQCA